MKRADAAGLLSLCLAALAARLAVWAWSGGFHYPDEIFQQVEPAHWLRTGNGWLAWEWGRGLRSWILPGLYAGMLELLHLAGLDGLAALRALTLHNALWSAAIVPAGWSIGRSLAPAGEERSTAFSVAALFSLWPTLAYFAPHTLSETPGLVLMAFGYAGWLAARREGGDELRYALLAGLLFGLAGMVRFTNGFHMLVPLADLLFRRRFDALRRLVLGALPGTLLLGGVDWASWGIPFHSVIEHVRYNWLEGRASEHGTSPWHTYFTVALWERLGPLAPLAAILLVIGAARAPLVGLAAFVPLVLLSTVAHKEERFVANGWPLLLALLALGLLALARRARGGAPVIAGVLALLVISNAAGTAHLPWRWRSDVFLAQDWAGRQHDATGLLVDGRAHLNGGHLLLARPIPQAPLTHHPQAGPSFNYAVTCDRDQGHWAARGWREAAAFGTCVVRRRESPLDAPGALR